jgi:hypothetical protein
MLQRCNATPTRRNAMLPRRNATLQRRNVTRPASQWDRLASQRETFRVATRPPRVAASRAGYTRAHRSCRCRTGELTPLTAAQRESLRNRTRMSNPVLQASINVVGALDNVSQAVGQPADEKRRLCQLHEEANRWTAVEDELRMMLNGVAGANLLRRRRMALLAAQAYNVGTQSARDADNSVLVPHVQEIKRLRSK